MFQRNNEKRIRKNKPDNKKVNLNKLVISFILAIILFFILISIEAGILNNYEKISLVRAKTDIKAGTEITPENRDTYFYMGEAAVNQCIDKPVVDLNKLNQTVITRDVLKNETIASQYIKSGNYNLAQMNNPIEVSLNVNTISDAVGGILRKGDKIDISVFNEETGESEVLFQDVYIQKALDNSGTEIDLYSKDKPATVINILIERDKQKVFNEMLQKEKIFISKVFE